MARVRTVDKYVSGVNAYLAEKHPLPIEYDILGFTPEPWVPADSLVWSKIMCVRRIRKI